MLEERNVDEPDREKPFKDALEAVRKGDFDDVKEALSRLGFAFDKTGDANHWMYYHSALRGDPHFRYPRNLYRPHGSRRSSDRISNHDRSQAKQMIQALKAVVGAAHEDGGE